MGIPSDILRLLRTEFATHVLGDILFKFMFCFLLRLWHSSVSDRDAAPLCLKISKYPFLPWQGVEGTSTDVLSARPLMWMTRLAYFTHPDPMVLLEAVTAAADSFDTSCRQNFCTNFSAGKTELRDAIAAGAAPLVQMRMCVRTLTRSAQITADGTSCSESPVWLMKPVFRSPSVQDIGWSSSHAFVLINVSMVTDLSSCAESLSSSSLSMLKWPRAPPQASLLVAWALPFQLDLQWVPIRILSLRLSYYMHIFVCICCFVVC